MQYRGLELDRFQEDAIRALEAGKSVLVCAPTGTGKTIIADWMVDVVLQRGREVVYTAPIKALANQKFRDYTRLHGEEKAGLVTGDLVIRRDAPCKVMTTEILRNMLLQGEGVPNLDAVIIDEIHFLDDRERGTVWEELLIYLPARVQIVGLSATLQNAKAFADWLGSVRGAPVHVVKEDKRSVPLEFLIANLDEGLVQPAEFDRRHKRWDKNNRPAKQGKHARVTRNQGPTTSHGDVFDMLADADLLPYLFFTFSRKATEQYARALGQRVRRSLLNRDETRRSHQLLDEFARSDSGNALEPELRGLYERGIAFHHAGLHVQLKALVEELYEAKLIKVLYCTSTFALGINMPARSTVFDALRKYDGHSLRPLTTREFMQKAGRAGRRGMDTVGHVVIRLDHKEWPDASGQLQSYLRGEPEPVRSNFSLSFNSIANLLQRNDRARIREIVDKSFLSFNRSIEAVRLRKEADRLGAERGKPKDIDKLNRRADLLDGRCWDEFERKVQFLTAIGYLAEDGTFNAGARVLAKVQIEEIFVTEMILSGHLEDIDDALLFGVLCAVNKEFGRDVRTRMRIQPGKEMETARALDRLRSSRVVTGAEEISGMSACWCPEMIPFGRAWAEGKSLADLGQFVSSTTDISGDLVGAFRRAKDLAGQLIDVYEDVPGRAESLKELIRKVSRDEVLAVD